MLPYPILSFKELEHYIELIAPLLKEARVDRVFVPETAAHPDHYFKKEWILDLSSPTQAFQLYFSVRHEQCGLVLLPTRLKKPHSKATRSGFDLSLNKNISGQ